MWRRFVGPGGDCVTQRGVRVSWQRSVGHEALQARPATRKRGAPSPGERRSPGRTQAACLPWWVLVQAQAQARPGVSAPGAVPAKQLVRAVRVLLRGGVVAAGGLTRSPVARRETSSGRQEA